MMIGGLFSVLASLWPSLEVERNNHNIFIPVLGSLNIMHKHTFPFSTSSFKAPSSGRFSSSALVRTDLM